MENQNAQSEKEKFENELSKVVTKLAELLNLFDFDCEVFEGKFKADKYSPSGTNEFYKSHMVPLKMIARTDVVPQMRIFKSSSSKHYAVVATIDLCMYVDDTASDKRKKSIAGSIYDENIFPIVRDYMLTFAEQQEAIFRIKSTEEATATVNYLFN